MNVDGKILVTILSSVSHVRFSRTFHNICDAEHWLLGLARTGLTERARRYLLDQTFAPAELPAPGPIAVNDRRAVKRMILPSRFE